MSCPRCGLDFDRKVTCRGARTYRCSRCGINKDVFVDVELTAFTDDPDSYDEVIPRWLPCIKEHLAETGLAEAFYQGEGTAVLQDAFDFRDLLTIIADKEWELRMTMVGSGTTRVFP